MTADPRIAPAFGGAHDYDAHARVQHRVAGQLADRIVALPLPAAPRVLEIGCGTGFLTAALHDRGLGGCWLVTDLAPAMVERCRARLGARPDTAFAVLDGEHGARPAEGPFDLICASLAFQWFADLPAAVARLRGWLAPRGHLVFTTLVAGTFAEWDAAHRTEGLAPGTLRFPGVADLAALCEGSLAIEHHREDHADARAFLRSVKAIGAGTPHTDHRPLSPTTLRRVMARFDQAGAQATYVVATCHHRRDP